RGDDRHGKWCVLERAQWTGARRSTSGILPEHTTREDAMNFVWFLLVGLVAGWLAGVLVKGGGFGLVGDIVVGIVGALIGGWTFSALGGPAGPNGLRGSIVVAPLGAVILLFVVRAIKRKA